MLLQMALFHSFLWLSRMGKPGGLLSMGSHRVGHDWSDLAAAVLCCIYIHHILIHSSVDGHLGCFHVLTIVNHAAVNTRVHVSFWIIVLSGYVPRSGSAGSYRNSIFSFLRNLQTASIVATLNYIPTNSVGGFLFLHTLSSICFIYIHTHTQWNIGGGNNPFQYCLENPMDRGAWWATVHGVAKSRTWLKRHSSMKY